MSLGQHKNMMSLGQQKIFHYYRSQSVLDIILLLRLFKYSD